MKTPSKLGIGGPFRRLTRLDAGLRGAEPRDRDHERRARHVRHADLVAELDRRRLTAVLATDADLEVGPRAAAPLDADLDELPDALLIENREGVERQEPFLKIVREERRDIVAAVPERHLREVVGAEGEELGGLRDLVGEQRRPRHLDHGPDEILHRDPHLRDDAVGDLLRLRVGELHLADGAGQRDHDLGLDRHARGRRRARRLHDRPHLHPVDLGIGDPEPAAAVPQHRVGLAQRLDLRDLLVEGALAFGVHAVRVETGALLEHLLVFLWRGEELVERRVEEADRDGQPVHRAEDPDEILALEREQLLDSRVARRRVGRHDHLAYDRDPVGSEEHVLGADEPDALTAELARLPGVLGRVGVRAPRAVTMPSEAYMPATSSGDVSGRTRMTCWPSRAASTARSALKTTCPTAPPGAAGSPRASRRPFASACSLSFGSSTGRKILLSSRGGTRSSAVCWSITLSRTRSTATP